MDDKDYGGYLKRAQFFGATSRTLDGLDGLAFRKPVIFSVPKGMEKYLVNVDGRGHSLSQFIHSAFRDTLITGWGGVLVDMPQSDSDNQSQKDVEDNDLYAYMTYYRAESIINWKWRTNGRRQELEYVIFNEDVEESTSEYATETKTYYRVCDIDGDGYYRQVLYNERLEPQFSINPSNRNGKFRYIPFMFLNGDVPDNPMLEDLANVNLSHYRKSADLENGAHWTGVPTPYERGWIPDTEVDENGNERVRNPVMLGGSQFLYFPPGTEQVGYLEFSGQGCNLLRDMMSDDEERMAILGARIISQQKKGVEAAETAKIHNAAENSVLASFAINMSFTFRWILKVYLEWSANADISDDSLDIRINTDYDVSTMSPQELTALVSLWQSGGIAKRDLFDNLKDGEILAADREFDEMNAEIDEEGTSVIKSAAANTDADTTQE